MIGEKDSIAHEVTQMDISTSIIMGVKEIAESDLIVTFFTHDKGRLTGIAKGGRKSRKRFPNCLDLLSLVRLEYKQSRNNKLHFLHSCRLINAFPELRSDFHLLSLASYMLELTRTLFPPEVADERMFEILKEALTALNKGSRMDILQIIFEAKAMALGGYKIALDRCCICNRPYTGKGTAVFKRDKGGIACLRCQQKTNLTPPLTPESIRALNLIQSSTWSEPALTTVSDETLNEIKTVLNLHMGYRIGKRIKAAKYLSQ